MRMESGALIYGIFSDVHSNFDAISAVINDMSHQGVEKYACVGDIVGYAAEPGKCINIIRDLNCQIVAGNHDYAVAGKLSVNHFINDAYEAIIWTKYILPKKDKDFLAGLPLVIDETDFTLVHATLHDPAMFIYMVNYQSIWQSLEILNTKLCFIGHTHIPVAFLYKDRQIFYSNDTEIDIQPWEKLIINVGSVGQPRDRDIRASYVIYDTSKEKIYFRRVSYDVDSAAKKIYETSLPRRNGDRLRS